MASAKAFASLIARFLDQYGVVMRSPIRMAHPNRSLTTLKVIMASRSAQRYTGGHTYCKSFSIAGV
jgi:hypothetical protein